MEKSADRYLPGHRRFVCRVLIVVFFLSAAFSAAAYGGLHPDKYFYAVNDSAVIYLTAPDPFSSVQQSIGYASIQQLMHYAPDGRDYDLQSLASTVNHGVDSITVSGLKPGTQMIILHSKNIFRTLPADSFKQYININQLKEVNEYSRSNKEDTDAGRIQYQLCNKTIFQAGNQYTDNCVQTTTLPLDIVPKKNVLSIKRASSVKMMFTVYFKGKPLKNCRLSIKHNGSLNEGQETILTTDKRGRIKPIIEANGKWTISAVKMIRATNNSNAGWQSYHGSLSWGYE